jgi:hypothetical protein
VHEIVHPQREERLGDQRQPRVRGQIHGAGRHFESERKNALAHRRAVLRYRIVGGEYYTASSPSSLFTFWVQRLSRLSREFST